MTVCAADTRSLPAAMAAARQTRNISSPSSSAAFCMSGGRLPAIALTADAATLTAIGNDYGYERVFARQLEGLAAQGDLLFAISTSGNSPNVLQAAQTARALGCVVVAHDRRAREQAGGASPIRACSIRAPSTVTARIQEVHTLCIHAIADSLDTLLQQRAHHERRRPPRRGQAPCWRFWIAIRECTSGSWATSCSTNTSWVRSSESHRKRPYPWCGCAIRSTGSEAPRTSHARLPRWAPRSVSPA